jgi:hypothetical protein
MAASQNVREAMARVNGKSFSVFSQHFFRVFYACKTFLLPSRHPRIWHEIGGKKDESLV